MQSAILFYQVCTSVCPSVRPSNVGTVSKRMDISSHFFKHFVSSVILVVRPHRHYKIPRVTPSAEALNIRGLENLANIALYRENGTR